MRGLIILGSAALSICSSSSIPIHGGGSAHAHSGTRGFRQGGGAAGSKASSMERMTREQVEQAMDQANVHQFSEQELRRLDLEYYTGAYPNFDNSVQYDKWSQGYRMIGPYIDCDHPKSEDNDDHQSGDNKNNQNHRDLKNNNQGTGYGCARWMMWAAYYNPNYGGNGYYEHNGQYGYYPDCHESTTEWQLIGVYREELYQWYEQLSKHMWAIDEFDYVVALAGLSYMTNADCQYVGNDSSGNALYAGPMPLARAEIQMGLYTDKYCISPSSTSMTYGDFGKESSMKLTSQDNGNYYYDLYDYWKGTQEYTLAYFNEVYEPFKSCTTCMDYPTYQDGFFIGDTGTDNDDLINQCWKFYSHDSFTCNGDCIALGSAQGTILKIRYNGYRFGKGEGYNSDGYYHTSSSSSSTTEEEEEEVAETTKVTNYLQSDRFATMKANAFIGLSSVLFLGTFLAFAVARGSARAIEKEDKAQVLLDDYYQDPYDKKKSRSSSSRKSSSSRGGSGARSSRSSRRSSRDGRSSGNTKSRSSRSRDGGATQRSRSRVSSSRRSSRGGGTESEDSDARRQRRRERRMSRSEDDGDSSPTPRRSSSRRKGSSSTRTSSQRMRDDF